jgi:citronellol/citronellal dehydrogenase
MTAFITRTCLRIDGGSSLHPKVYPLPKHANSQPYQAFHRAHLPRVSSHKKTIE